MSFRSCALLHDIERETTQKRVTIFHGRREAESAIQQRFHPRILIVLGVTRGYLPANQASSHHPRSNEYLCILWATKNTSVVKPTNVLRTDVTKIQMIQSI